jgi:hypothetical protein
MTVRPSIIADASTIRWQMKLGATVPCCDSATAASDVIRARDAAPLTTKIRGLPARSARSSVARTARRSCGLGRVGMTTRSLCSMTRRIGMLTAGGVSMNT